MRSVLVTGGSGYFAKGFVRAALARDVHRVCVFSRGEYAQALMREEFDNDPRIRWFIGCVRDVDRLTRAMEGCDTVIHAAALKRVEVGQYNPDEMRKTNVNGAENVVAAARSTGARKVVALSTDKAVEASNTYGKSKALAEDIFISAQKLRVQHDPSYVVCRYGNVAGSTGSVIPTWRRALKEGRMVQLTDAACTRYWMSLDEAVNLVEYCATSPVGLHPLVTPFLPAYRLGDLAEAMGVTYSVTGLGDGEKLHESMNPGETSEHARRMSIEELKEALSHV